MCLFQLLNEQQRRNIHLMVFLGLFFVTLFPMVSSQLSGSIQKCTNEGEDVYVPLISDNPCISCMCEEGEVRCKRVDCPSLEGCYMILFDNLKHKKRCCEVCKRCYYNGKYFDHNQTWTEAEDPCVSLTCRAGVVTRSSIKCYTSCPNPVSKPGQCCPVCPDCRHDNQTYKDGDRFHLSTDPCTECSCRKGMVSCQKKSCPVLNCPDNVIYKPEGGCCPQCKGKRRIFNLPGGRCFVQNRIYKTGESFTPGECTQCTCMEGTAVCDRQTCPPINCTLEDTVKENGSCCRVCQFKRSCEYDGKMFKDSMQWKPNLCTMCSCDDGSTRCQVQNCRNTWCPPGYKLQYVQDECCPRCLEVKGVCTVFGDPHYRTFDGRIYNFQGPCKYMLVHDDVGKTFSIRVRNDARTSPWFTWTRMLAIFLENDKITLLQKLVVKVNSKRVKLPFKTKDFSVVRDGHSIIFQAGIGLKVTWDGDSYLEVSVSSRYKRRLKGLCGNYNGIGADDLTGRDGLIYFIGEEFGNTWRVGSKAACSISDHIKKEESPCKIDPSRKKRAKKECSLLLSTVFYICRRKVDVREFYRSCIADMCDCPTDKYCNCESFKAYAHACSQKQIFVKWEGHAICPKECPIGALYKKCSRRCAKTCDEPNKKGYCSKKCVPGCVCPRNRVLHENKCIRAKKCPKR